MIQNKKCKMHNSKFFQSLFFYIKPHYIVSITLSLSLIFLFPLCRTLKREKKDTTRCIRTNIM